MKQKPDFREATTADVPAMAQCRMSDPTDGGAIDQRMAAYFDRQHHPREALLPRVGYLALDQGTIVGYIAGHETRRNGCSGEVQYLFVAPLYRRKGIGTALLRLLAAWFQERGVLRVCVGIAGDSPREAKPFYESVGASPLLPHWYGWDIGGTMKISPEIRSYYETAPEAERLLTGPSQLEFARTKELLLERFPKPPAIVLDVGGGPGTYACWLADLGYEVHLIDPVQHLVNHAQRRSDQAPRHVASCRVGDARELKFEDRSIDVVLELGPLYHLIRREDRLLALTEAFRVLKPGGRIFAAAISRLASALDGLSRDLLADPTFQTIVKTDLEEGIHRNETGKLDYFTTAKFHRPEELREEVLEAGFTSVEAFGIEGPAWTLGDFEERWRDSRRRQDVLDTARRLEREPSIQGASAHLLAVGVKPE